MTHSHYWNIAEVCHEANRAHCRNHGDFSQPHWHDAPDWQRESAYQGVAAIIEGRVTAPEQSHESWSVHKLNEGWVYGAEKDPVAMTHPCLVPFSALPAHQQQKDRLFFAIVNALR